MYAVGMYRYTFWLAALSIAGCNNEIYLRDGVTDGDTFYLADRALTDGDPVVQSWVSYSLTRSACQLRLGGENPARASSYRCELTARQHLLDSWEEKRAGRPGVSDRYLDELLTVRNAGFLDEYTVRYFGHSTWQVPAELDAADFQAWRRKHLRGHKAETRIIGAWGYGRPP